MQPGTRSHVRFLLREPLQLLPGDRFIVRMFSPVVTIGGGAVVDVNPPGRSNAERLRTLEAGTPAQRIELLAAESKWGAGMRELVARTGLLESEIARAASNSSALLAL